MISHTIHQRLRHAQAIGGRHEHHVGRDRQTPGADWRGDPSSALRKSGFRNRQHRRRPLLEVDYDLSDVMFVTTANSLRMPQPLMDRMEIISHPGLYRR